MSENPFESLESDDPTFALTVRDRLPYAYILTKQIQNFQQANINQKDFFSQDVQNAIRGLVKMIPESWTRSDEEWQDDMKKAIIKKKIDIRPKFGDVRASKELCKKNGWQMFKIIEIPDYFQLLQTVINKLNRLGMITRKEWTEAPTGMPKGETSLPEGMNLIEYLETLEEETNEDEKG